MSRFYRGHLDNTGEHPDAHKLLTAHVGTATLPPLPTPDLRAFDGPIADQGKAGSCGAFGFGRQLAVFFRANEMTKNWLFPDPLFTYAAARLQEWAGQDPGIIPPLRDTGVQPALLLKATQAVGFILWNDDPNFTYPTDFDTLTNEQKMAAIVNRPIPPEAAMRAFDQSALQYGLYQGDPTKVADWIEECLRNRLPVTFGMQVDAAYEQNSGELVTNIDLANSLGGHDQCIVAVDEHGNFIVTGSWGYAGGNAGIFVIARSVINNPAICGDFQIVKAAPLPEGT